MQSKHGIIVISSGWPVPSKHAYFSAQTHLIQKLITRFSRCVRQQVLLKHFGDTLTCNTEKCACTTPTARQELHLVLQLCNITLGYRAWHLSQELCNALWHHLTRQQLDPCARYKKKPAQYALHGHHGRDDETKEDVVGGSEEEKNRE